ncbi:alpha/beta hydrolase [Asanoa sp. WMMD1127]|uniref:alpha/beta fold hydrolase n=1 Tax=Asanoa sp. WMMD1127 TaxID=3016107 RepID=UPI002417BE6B|nr:alpha/beta hydrolase [Asanoa sp. WMMD1127]MDG4820821.1 alpha/beta hydrolase [Asanoa sp. WMMD1127]
MLINRRRALAGIGAAALVTTTTTLATTATPDAASAGRVPVPDDAELARSLPGRFRSHHTSVNGTRLHYVAGGAGEPLFLLPGWPATWWSYRKIMPALARRFRVVVPDLRGMGGSAKPHNGFDKRTMARDVYELACRLGYRSVNIAGHDIGAMVAFSFAANHRAATRRVALLDVLHPDRSFYEWRLLQPAGGDTNMWWMAFNQVDGLPEQLIAGRARHLIDWHYGIGLVDQSNVSERDRAVFANAYDSVDAIRASNGWYKAFHQDIADMETYAKVSAPLLGLAAPATVPWFEGALPFVAADVRGVVAVDNTLHWLADEAPEVVGRALIDFFG